MRIDPAQTAHISYMSARPRAATQAPAESAVSRRSDGVQLSDGIGRLRRAHAAASQAADVRAERVADIKAQVQAGTYQVDTQALAEKMLSRI